jgi:RNA polymerase sigma-70 factor (ECF subfamily)
MMRWAAERLAGLGTRADADAGADDGDLVRRARRGDASAFDGLVRLYQDRIYRLALRMVGPEAAEDVAQQAFVKAWQALDRFDERSTFGTWLYRIAINACLDELRRMSRERPVPLDDVAWTLAGDDDVAEMVAEEDALDRRRAALAWALERLPSEDRLILHLRTGEERSYEEIGALLGLNIRTVGTRLYRARARLHALVMGRLAGGDEDGQGEDGRREGRDRHDLR